jgi:hypothetical protein
MKMKMKKRTAKPIFVPFEYWPGKKGVKCDDLPRFDRIEDVRTYFMTNSALFAHRKIAWEEITAKWAQDEFETGVGKLKVLL